LRIPDAYKVTFNFKSLLPNNFNQYMMTYNENDSIIDAGYTRHVTAVGDVAGIVSNALQSTLFNEELGKLTNGPVLPPANIDDSVEQVLKELNEE